LNLTVKVIPEPEQKTKSNAEDKASDNREVNGGVFAAADDVAREAAETEGELGAEKQQRTDHDGHAAENQERPA
jgi:hypothetical protein